MAEDMVPAHCQGAERSPGSELKYSQLATPPKSWYELTRLRTVFCAVVMSFADFEELTSPVIGRFGRRLY